MITAVYLLRSQVPVFSRCVRLFALGTGYCVRRTSGAFPLFLRPRPLSDMPPVSCPPIASSVPLIPRGMCVPVVSSVNLTVPLSFFLSCPLGSHRTAEVLSCNDLDHPILGRSWIVPGGVAVEWMMLTL